MIPESIMMQAWYGSMQEFSHNQISSSGTTCSYANCSDSRKGSARHSLSGLQVEAPLSSGG